MGTVERPVGIVLVGSFVGVLLAWWRAPAPSAPADPPAARAAPSSPPRAGRVPPSTAPARAAVLQRDLSPTDARYDAFARTREDPDLRLPSVFESEPRDPSFAPVQEHRVRAALDEITRELGLGEVIREVHAECHTLSCRTTIAVPREALEDVYRQLNGLLLGDAQHSVMHAAPDPALGEITIYNVYRAATREDATYARMLDEAMRAPLELVKEDNAQRRRSAAGAAVDAGPRGGAP